MLDSFHHLLFGSHPFFFPATMELNNQIWASLFGPRSNGSRFLGQPTPQPLSLLFLFRDLIRSSRSGPGSISRWQNIRLTQLSLPKFPRLPFSQSARLFLRSPVLPSQIPQRATPKQLFIPTHVFKPKIGKPSIKKRSNKGGFSLKWENQVKKKLIIC